MRDDVAARQVEHRHLGSFFVGDVESLAVGREIEGLRILPAWEESDQLACLEIDEPDSVCGTVGWRQLRLVDAGAPDRRAGQRDQQLLAVP